MSLPKGATLIRWQAIKAMYDEVGNSVLVARHFQMSRSRVKGIIVRLGGSLKTWGADNKLDDDKVEQILAMRRDHPDWSNVQIGQKLKVGSGTVGRYTRLFGVSRTYGGHPRRPAATPARQPRRRCQTPDCFTVTTAMTCPRCGQTMYEPDPLDRVEVVDPRHGTRPCHACGEPFPANNAKHIYCHACGQARRNVARHLERTKPHTERT